MCFNIIFSLVLEIPLWSKECEKEKSNPNQVCFICVAKVINLHQELYTLYNIQQCVSIDHHT